MIKVEPRMPQRPATSDALVRKRPALEGPRARPSSARGTNDGNLRLWELYKRKGLTDGSLRKSALPPTLVSQPLVYERRWCSLSPKPKPAAAARRAKMRAETERVGWGATLYCYPARSCRTLYQHSTSEHILYEENTFYSQKPHSIPKTHQPNPQTTQSKALKRLFIFART